MKTMNIEGTTWVRVQDVNRLLGRVEAAAHAVACALGDFEAAPESKTKPRRIRRSVARLVLGGAEQPNLAETKPARLSDMDAKQRILSEARLAVSVTVASSCELLSLRTPRAQRLLDELVSKGRLEKRPAPGGGTLYSLPPVGSMQGKDATEPEAMA
jgi:hypothetical protein